MSGRRFRDRYTEALWGPTALRPNETLVALAYAKYAGAKDNPDDVAWVSWETLAELTGIRAKSTLSRIIQALTAAGWIELLEPPKQHRSPRYRLTIPDNPEVRVRYPCNTARGSETKPLRGSEFGPLTLLRGSDLHSQR